MKTLKVGDRIRIVNTFNNYIVEIVRVTKTMAIAKTPFDNEMRFKINYYDSPNPSPKHKWDTTDYTVL